MAIKTERGVKDGSDALLYAMVKYVKENSSKDLINLTFDEFKKMLKGNVEIPLLEKRYNTILNIRKVVNEKMNGNFYKYIYNATTDV